MATRPVAQWAEPRKLSKELPNSGVHIRQEGQGHGPILASLRATLRSPNVSLICYMESYNSLRGVQSSGREQDLSLAIGTPQEWWWGPGQTL